MTTGLSKGKAESRWSYRIPWPHRGWSQHEGSKVSPYFLTDLSRLMAAHPITLCRHGHTHTNNNGLFAENGCRVVPNQRGYPGKVATSGFRPDLVIEI